MARIAGVNIPTNKIVLVGLTYIYGIGNKFSSQICKALNIPPSKRVNELSDEQILKIIKGVNCGVLHFMRFVPAIYFSFFLFSSLDTSNKLATISDHDRASMDLS